MNRVVRGAWGGCSGFPGKAADLDHPNVLKHHWRMIFKNELEGWCTDKSAWPKDLSEEMFRAWFTLDFCTMVYDRGKEPLRLED